MTSEPSSVYDAVLPADEFDRRLADAISSMDGREGDDARDLIAWFLRKYPSPLERLAYTRRKYREVMSLRARAAKR